MFFIFIYYRVFYLESVDFEKHRSKSNCLTPKSKSNISIWETLFIPMYYIMWDFSALNFGFTIYQGGMMMTTF